MVGSAKRRTLWEISDFPHGGEARTQGLGALWKGFSVGMCLFFFSGQNLSGRVKVPFPLWRGWLVLFQTRCSAAPLILVPGGEMAMSFERTMSMVRDHGIAAKPIVSSRLQQSKPSIRRCSAGIGWLRMSRTRLVPVHAPRGVHDRRQDGE